MKNLLPILFLTACCILLSLLMTCQRPTGANDGSDTITVDSICIDSSKINLQQACPRNYDPVCGCDGKTYSNECEAKKHGVTTWEKGKCPCIVESLIKKDQICTREYKPVCGCDNKTYSNECEARKAGLTEWKPGKCE